MDQRFRSIQQQQVRRAQFDQLVYVPGKCGNKLAMLRDQPLSQTFADSVNHDIVFLQHGTASCGLAFDLPRGPSLARWLQSHGYCCYAGNLREQFPSMTPTAGPAQSPATVQDYVDDVAAMLTHIRAHHPGQRIHLIGHSLGGILGLLYAIQQADNPKALPQLASLTLLGSSMHYADGHTEFAAITGLVPLANMIGRLPMFGLGLLLQYLPVTNNPMVRFNLNPNNVDRDVVKYVLTSAARNESAVMLAQLSCLIDGRPFRDPADGQDYREKLANIQSPILSIAGSDDRQCSIEAAAATMDACTNSQTQLLVASQRNCQTNYGHYDMLVGRTVDVEIWPHIARHFQSV